MYKQNTTRLSRGPPAASVFFEPMSDPRRFLGVGEMLIHTEPGRGPSYVGLLAIVAVSAGIGVLLAIIGVSPTVLIVVAATSATLVCVVGLGLWKCRSRRSIVLTNNCVHRFGGVLRTRVTTIDLGRVCEIRTVRAVWNVHSDRGRVEIRSDRDGGVVISEHVEDALRLDRLVNESVGAMMR